MKLEKLITGYINSGPIHRAIVITAMANWAAEALANKEAILRDSAANVVSGEAIIEAAIVWQTMFNQARA